MEIIYQVSWLVLILFIWFNTDALESYLNLFKFKFSKIDEFNEYKKSVPKSEYLSFLRIKYNNFFVKLISCKPCLLFWLNIGFSFYLESFLHFAITYLSSYVIYNLIIKYV